MKPSLKMGFEKQFTSGGRDWSLFLHVTRVARQLIVTGRLQTIEPGGYPLDNLPVQQARERLTRFFYPSHCISFCLRLQRCLTKEEKRVLGLILCSRVGTGLVCGRGIDLFLWRIKPWSNHLTFLDSTIITVKPTFTVPRGESKIARYIEGHG